MKIYVKSVERERPIRLYIPLALFKSRFLLKLIFKDKDMPDINPEDVKKLVNELKLAKKYFPRLQLVDVESNDGNVVKIRL